MSYSNTLTHAAVSRKFVGKENTKCTRNNLEKLPGYPFINEF